MLLKFENCLENSKYTKQDTNVQVSFQLFRYGKTQKCVCLTNVFSYTPLYMLDLKPPTEKGARAAKVGRLRTNPQTCRKPLISTEEATTAVVTSHGKHRLGPTV